jgi:ABC-type branched-subunit amino acid transport system permease subunit
VSTALRRAAIALGGVALVAYPLVRLDDVYGQSVLIFAFLLALMASGWNIMAGFTGYVSIGQSAFLGIGAYTVALLGLRTGISPLLLAPLGGVAAALVAAVLGATVMRAREHAFVIITIALLFLFQALALNLEGITGGSNGSPCRCRPGTGTSRTCPSTTPCSGWRRCRCCCRGGSGGRSSAWA